MLDHLTHHVHAIIALDLFPANIEHIYLSFTRQTKVCLAADANVAFSAQYACPCTNSLSLAPSEYLRRQWLTTGTLATEMPLGC
jgi:hypothetical protein